MILLNTLNTFKLRHENKLNINNINKAFFIAKSRPYENYFIFQLRINQLNHYLVSLKSIF